MGNAVAAAGAVPRIRRRAALREQLAELGWTPLRTTVRVVSANRCRYRLTDLAERSGRVARLCERVGSASLADYPNRRAVHRRTAGVSAPVVTVFTDAASTSEVWSWIDPGSGEAPAYREQFREMGEPPPAVAAEPARAAAPLDWREHRQWRDGAGETSRALLGRLLRRGSLREAMPATRGRTPAARLQELVEGSRTPDLVRTVWRELGDLSVLDPACGSGSWLLGCLEALVWVGMACVTRMRGWVEDGRHSGRRLRPERYSDFRAVLLRSDSLAHCGHDRRFATELALGRCLHGLHAESGGAASVRTLLAARLTANGATPEATGIGEALVDIRPGVLASTPPARGSKSPPPWGADAAREEAEALFRAEEQLRCGRVRDGGSLHELAAGLEAIRRRRVALAHSIVAHGGTRDHPGSLHPWIEYYGILKSGGFDLVRDASPRRVAAG